MPIDEKGRLFFIITLKPAALPGLNVSTYVDDIAMLSLYDPVNSPHGLTGKYIEARAEMLVFKTLYDKLGIDYSDRLNAIGGLFPSIEGDHIFQDSESDLTLDIDGFNPTTFDSHYIRFGGKDSDTLIGDDLEDRLFGGAGDGHFCAARCGRDQLA